jgi:ribA/ribD-fused uncharacterized protein
MAPGFPLAINGHKIRTAEALYQACRFPNNPEIQSAVIAETSPMTAKMRTKPFREKFSRPDWFSVRTKIMRWCLRVKLAQNFQMFSELLLATGDLNIVEDSRKDDFWGAVPDGDLLVGSNVLGRLLMELRELVKSSPPDELRDVSSLDIENFALLGEQILGLNNGKQVPPHREKAILLKETRVHLFVSYATEDGQFVDWLCLKLISEGYKVWCDRLKLLGGESYPRDIDDAIKTGTFRFISVLSKYSLKKPNPIKERTLALNISKERKEDFVIPVNLDGLKPTELGWMESDLSFIPFWTGWGEGLRKLLLALEKANTPREKRHQFAVSQILNQQVAIKDEPETLWSNMVELLQIPKKLYRYEHRNACNVAQAVQLQKEWPHYRENASVCWSFEPPPESAISKFDFSFRGACEDWRGADSPDINFFNLGKKVLNASFTHKFLSAGLLQEPATGVLFVPKGATPERFSYHLPSERKSWILTTGLRRIKRPDRVETFRYHLSPECRVLLDYFGSDIVQFRTRLHLTDEKGVSLDPKLIQKRRKTICKSWWNYQWLARLFATLELLADQSGKIRIGVSGDIELSRWPRMLLTETSLDEELLKPASLAAEEFIDSMKDDSEMNTEVAVIKTVTS